MRKPVFIAATLALAIAVMGAGYAAWSENITINNDLQTGDLRIEFVQAGLHPWISGFDNTLTSPAKINTTITHGPKITYVSISNLYPGATALFETRIENLGSIPAVADGVEVIFPNATAQTDKLKQNIICRGQIMHWRMINGVPSLIDTRGIDPINGVTLANLETTLSTMINSMTVDEETLFRPGDFFTFDIDDDYANQLKALPDFGGYDPAGQNCLLLTLPSSAGNDTESLLNTEFQIKFNFKQFNK